MEISFLKENIVKSTKNDKTGKNALKLLKIIKQNEFLFEKNIPIFNEMLDFFDSKYDVWFLTGYSLSGKSLVTSVLPKIISDNAIFQFFKCTPSSTIDDMLLSFFETFRTYAQKKLIHLPKIEAKEFHERINAYIAKCENPIVILVDDFNEIKNQKAKDEIMLFLSRIAEFKNIKMVIASRSFDINDLKNINIRVETSLIKPLTMEKLNEYCLRNVIKSDGLDEFYRLSHGHYKSLSLMMSYIQPTNTDIKEFVKEANASTRSFDEFAVVKNLSLIPDAYSNLLWIMSTVNFGIPKKNIMNLISGDEEQLNSLLKKGIIENVNDIYYIKDFYRDEIIKSIEPIAHQNIKKAIVKFLERQLPLKPAERELKLSRITIRNEISRLSEKEVKNAPKIQEKTNTAYLNILGYSKQFKTNWDGFDDIIMPKKDAFDEIINKNVEKVEAQVNPPEFEADNKKSEEEQTDLKLAQILKDNYSYDEAIVQYSEALSKALTENNTDKILLIYESIAECYYKVGNYDNAIENYAKAHELAKKENLTNECDEIMLKIAELYKATYKHDLAKEIYNDILSKDGTSEKVKLNAELNLFETNFSELTPKEIIKTYYNLLEKSKNDKELSAKIHFRLGFLYDNASSVEEAELHYKKSIELCDDYHINQNLSSCYYNLAEINYEKRDIETALSCYLKSFVIDEITKKAEDALISSKKIAKIYEKKKNNLALEYYEKALDFAKTMNDNYPVACAYMDLGDYYYRKKEDLKALKNYMAAQKTMENQLTAENEIAIKDRINDLKIRMGKEVVENMIKEFY